MIDQVPQYKQPGPASQEDQVVYDSMAENYFKSINEIERLRATLRVARDELERINLVLGLEYGAWAVNLVALTKINEVLGKD